MPLLLTRYIFALMLLLCSLGLSAQTSVTPSQLKTSKVAAPPSSYIFLAYTPGGSFRAVKLGTGLVLNVDPTTGQATLQAIPQVPNFKIDFEPAELVPDGQGNIPAPAGKAMVFRNGILQKEGFDYTIAGGFLVPNPEAGWTLTSTPEVTKDTLLAVKLNFAVVP